MALTEHYYMKFEEGNFYHIYNRSIDRKPMFRNAGNFEFFLRKYDSYLSPVLDTFAYCLLGNHFHLLVKIKDLPTIDNPLKTVHDRVSHQFRKFFQSYAMAYNKQQNRILFQTPFKRVCIDNDKYFTNLIYYIHANPRHHGLIDDFKEWKWSSYGRILIDKPSKLKKQEVINWFGDRNDYEHFYSIQQKIIYTEKYIMEDD